MSKPIQSVSENGLVIRGFAGQTAVLLAFSLPESALTRPGPLAGFAISRALPGQPPVMLSNRLSFSIGIDRTTTADARRWFPSDEAPFQKFRWIDVPTTAATGNISYTVTARHWVGEKLVDGTSASIVLTLPGCSYADFQLAFTRGYIASQAYADKFKNEPISPKEKSIDFDTTQYQVQYEWLGGKAREAVFGFLKDCEQQDVLVDIFSFDLDEPNVIDCFANLGKQGKLRLIQDNASLHVGSKAMEPLALAKIRASAGAARIKVGHFGRFAHNKCIIVRDRASGKGIRVLTGSANFSLRGLYVQANNVIVLNNQRAADLYALAFQTAWNGQVKRDTFVDSKVSPGWFNPELVTISPPEIGLSFAPHASGNISLDAVASFINQAKRSVFFAIMDISENVSGPVLNAIRALPERESIFYYGTAQTATGVVVQKPASGIMTTRRAKSSKPPPQSVLPHGEFVTFSALKRLVPAPFQAEFDGGPGQTIHDKFIVVDFDTDSPVVFSGSSNLAAGGESENGDNLLAIFDGAVATAFAVEAVRLFDHYEFRSAVNASTKASPLLLKAQSDGPAWYAPYFDESNIKCRDRKLFAGITD
jgi:hypothetical protein